MYRRNDGSGNTNVLQNQFTAYLTKAMRNVRNRYIRSRARQHESVFGKIEIEQKGAKM